MISEQAFKKTEGMLYRYYKNIRKKDRTQHKRYSLENRINQIRRDIKETNVELDDGMGAIDYSKDRVQSSPTGVGPGEQSLMREMTKLENELKVTIKGKLKLQAKIRELEAKISDTEYVINKLSEEYKRLIELKYASSFKMSNTVRRKGVEVVEAIAKWMNVV